MKKYRLSLAVVTAMVVGATSMGAAASDRIFEAKIHDPAEAPAMGTPGNRFVVKFEAPAGRTVDDRVKSMSLNSAVSRAGLGQSLRGMNAAGPGGGVSARLDAQMGTPGWQVVTTSRRLSAAESERFLRELEADPSIAVAEPDRMYHHMGNAAPATAPDDPQYEEFQWNFMDGPGGVRAEEGWQISTGEGVVVAVIDTGIVENHADLQANVVPGYDMISWFEISRRDSDGRVPGGWDIGDWVEANYCTQLGSAPHPAESSSWHGSHVAGTVAQETNNGSGLAGLAHDAQVMPIRALGSCGGLGSDIADGMLWAAGIEVPGLPINENPAEVINMSLGSRVPTECSALYQDAIDQVNATGTIIVVAAGNDNDNAADYTMSSCDGVISVGATNVHGAKSYYSSWGPVVDVSAPGGDFSIPADGNDQAIWQVTNSGEQGPVYDVDGAWILRGFQGTSMSSPHVAAAVAMVQSVVDMPLGLEEMRSLLKETTTPFSSAPSNPIGTGILNLGALLAKAIEEPCDPEVEECEEPGIEATPLYNKVPVSGLTGTAGSEVLYALEVPEGVTGLLNITTHGGSGDVSMYVSLDDEPQADASDWRSTRPGNNETVRINNPAAGTYYIKLAGDRAYNNVTLQGRFEAPDNGGGPGGNELENGVPVTGISGAAGSEQFWTIEVPDGTASLSVVMQGEVGDADLYVRHGAQPTDTAYDCRPWLIGSNETCTFDNPQAGTWHIRIYGWSAFEGVSLTGSY